MAHSDSTNQFLQVEVQLLLYQFLLVFSAKN